MKDERNLNEKESEALRTITEICFDKKVAVSFSCGKDSLVVMDLASRVGIKKAVFSDTTLEFDETYEYLELIKDFYDIDVVKPPKDFFSLVDALDLPSRRYKWCCDVIKFGPLSRYAEKNDIAAYITGLRREESKKRECYDIINFNPAMTIPQVNPILDWSSEDIWNYINKYEIPYNPLYEDFSRVGCWCCPYCSKGDWEVIKNKFPDKYQKLQNIIRKKAHNIKPDYRQQFINNGWTSWVYPLKKLTVGKFEFDENSNVFRVKMNYETETEKVKDLIKVLGNKYSINGNYIEISLNNEKIKEEKKKIQVVVEKAVNCVQCGSCLHLCERNALYVDENIKVNDALCDNCDSCLLPNGNAKLRMMCIARNYSRNGKTLILS